MLVTLGWIVGWVVGILLIIYGLYGFVLIGSFAKVNGELAKAEIEMMKKNALSEGESEQTIGSRAARLERDLETERDIIFGLALVRFASPLFAGFVLVGSLVLKAWFS